MILNKKLMNGMEKTITPNDFWRKKCNVYGADYMDIDWKSLQEEEKDYSKEAFQEYVLSKIKAISKLDKKEEIELNSPNKSEYGHSFAKMDFFLKHTEIEIKAQERGLI